MKIENRGWNISQQVYELRHTSLTVKNEGTWVLKKKKTTQQWVLGKNDLWYSENKQ